MKKLLFLFLMAAIGSAFCEGKLFIQNQKNKPVSLKIIFEGKENMHLKQKIPPRSQRIIKLKHRDLNGLRYYALRGTVPPFFKGDKCEKLKPMKDYFITFTDDPVGTTCFAYEK